MGVLSVGQAPVHKLLAPHSRAAPLHIQATPPHTPHTLHTLHTPRTPREQGEEVHTQALCRPVEEQEVVEGVVPRSPEAPLHSQAAPPHTPRTPHTPHTPQEPEEEEQEGEVRRQVLAPRRLAEVQEGVGAAPRSREAPPLAPRRSRLLRPGWSPEAGPVGRKRRWERGGSTWPLLSPLQSRKYPASQED